METRNWNSTNGFGNFSCWLWWNLSVSIPKEDMLSQLQHLLLCPRSGAEGAPADLCGRNEQPAWPLLHQSGPPQQAGRPDPVQSQRLEGSLRPCSRSVRRTRGVQHWMVSRTLQPASSMQTAARINVTAWLMSASTLKPTLSSMKTTKDCWASHQTCCDVSWLYTLEIIQPNRFMEYWRHWWNWHKKIVKLFIVSCNAAF